MSMANGLMDFEDEEKDANAQAQEDFNNGTIDDSDDDASEREEVDLLKSLLEESDYEDEDGEGEGDPGEGAAETADPEQSEEQNAGNQEEPPAQDWKTEENARNAERRRQQEQAAFMQRMMQTPEFALAQQLQERFGKTPDQLLAELQQAELQRQAEQQQVPVEFLQRLHQAEQVAQQTAAMFEEYQNRQGFMEWQNRMNAETATVKQEYPMLSDDDITAAKTYMLQTLKNTDVSLEQAVLAIHGKKIMSGLKESAQNEALAEASGRKRAAVTPPKSAGKSAPTKTLTEEEAYIAKSLGMSEADYLKYKV